MRDFRGGSSRSLLSDNAQSGRPLGRGEAPSRSHRGDCEAHCSRAAGCRQRVASGNGLLIQAVRVHSEPVKILSRAVRRCATDLELTDDALACVLGIPLRRRASVRDGALLLSERSPEWHRACQLVEIHRGLAMFWGDPKTAAAWLRSFNRAFGEVPLNVFQAPDGLNRLLAYVRTIEEAPFG